MFRWNYKPQLPGSTKNPVLVEPLAESEKPTSQKIGGWVSQGGNAIILWNSWVLKDMRSFVSTLPAIGSDSIFSLPFRESKEEICGPPKSPEEKMERERKWEATCYSLAAVLVTGLLVLFRTSHAAASNPEFEKALLLQTRVWAVGTLRYPLEYIAGKYFEDRKPNLAKWLKRTGRVIPALVTVAMLPVRFELITSLGLFKPETYTEGHHNLLRLFFLSPAGNTVRLLTAHSIYAAADIFKGNIPDAIHQVGQWGLEDNEFSRPKLKSRTAAQGGPGGAG